MSETGDSFLSGAAGIQEPDFSGGTQEIGGILEKALAGQEVSVAEGAVLLKADGADLHGLFSTADRLRFEAVGDQVTYVVNRNINFTNVCIRHCGFCAFSRGHLAEEGYFLPLEEVVARAHQAAEIGATEVCVQAGLSPGMAPWYYVDVCSAISKALPEMHIHGFSPEEIGYGAKLAGVSPAEYLEAMKEAGLGSLPGTAAEVLVQSVRDVISPGRITVKEWVEVITAAHKLDIPTTSTLMYGHVETPEEVATHLALLRSIQKETGGFTEFVPLGFVHSEAPMAQKRVPAGLRKGPSGVETLKMYAVARIMLHGWISNIQVSWVKEGPKLSQIGLMTGCNDLGGTLINESISTAAGAAHGQLQTPASLRQLAREMGRVPAERTTTYGIRQVFTDPSQDPLDPLDRIEDPSTFGSYKELIAKKEHRFKDTLKK